MRHPSLRAEKSWYRISNFNVDLRVGYYWFKMTAYSPAFFARKSVSASFENYLSDLENFKRIKVASTTILHGLTSPYFCHIVLVILVWIIWYRIN